MHLSSEQPGKQQIKLQPGDLDLEFPSDPGFKPAPPRVSVDRMIQFSAERLARANANSQVQQDRLRDMCDVPFEL